MIRLDGESLTLGDISRIASGEKITITTTSKKKVLAGRKIVQNAIKCGKPVYGVNTGFGFLAKERIDQNDLLTLQSNLLKSHAAGWGPPLSISETRLAMTLRLNILLKGNTGVRYELCQALLKLIQAEIYSIIPEYGSVGASGDLAPLAHLALPLMGQGKVIYRGKAITAKTALSLAGLKPFQLAEKEGLGLINGTQIMLAVGSLALVSSKILLRQADTITALTCEALQSSLEPFHSSIHQARQQKGQIASAKMIWKALQGSYLHKTKHPRLQDPYSIRCAPQIHGPSHDAVAYASRVIEAELNAATDNPLVLGSKILSGGNFHGQALGMAYDFAAMAMAEIGNVSERRLEILLNPSLSNGLPAFLSPKEGLHSGYMALQYLSASLVNENKLLANPSCTDSIPGNAGTEDHVSMGMTSARKLKQVVKNTRTILAIEALCAAQGIDLRGIEQLGKGTAILYGREVTLFYFLFRKPWYALRYYLGI